MTGAGNVRCAQHGFHAGFVAEVLGDNPRLGKRIINVMSEMMGVFSMRMTPGMIMGMMPDMIPLMLRHPTLIPPFMKAMPGMMRKPKEAGNKDE